MGHKWMICQYYVSLVHTPVYLRSWKLFTFQCAARQRAAKPLVDWGLTSTSPCSSSFGTILSLGIAAQRSFFVKFYFSWFNSCFLAGREFSKINKTSYQSEYSQLMTKPWNRKVISWGERLVLFWMKGRVQRSCNICCKWVVMVNIPVSKFISSEIHEWTETKKYV